MRLEDLVERLGRSSRGVSITWVNVRERRIEATVSKMLANQEGISALLNHQHGSSVLQNMRVLQGLSKASLDSDLPEHPVNRRAIHLSGLLAVEHEFVSVSFPDSHPSFERSVLVKQRVALYLQQVLS